MAIYLSTMRIFLLVGVLLTDAVTGCFDKRIGCVGDTPSINPFLFPEMIRKNMATIMKDTPELFSPFADKVWFKDYCKRKHVPFIENIAVFDQNDYKNIRWESLPQSFALKSNKGSGRNIIVREGLVSYGKLAIPLGPVATAWPTVLGRISGWGSRYYDQSGNMTEPWYEYIHPMIIVEPLIEPPPDDIRVFVINQTVQLIYYNEGSKRHRTNIYDAKFNLLPYGTVFGRATFDDSEIMAVLKTPANIAAMHAAALRLAEDVPLDIVRIDLYHINDTFYGSEITMSSFAGDPFIRPITKHHISKSSSSFS